MEIDNVISFLPNTSVPFISKWLENQPKIGLSASKPRKTKLGDYRFVRSSYNHAITVNNNLSEEAFFLTLTHEIAHFLAYQRYGFRISPHGKEWKKTFQELIVESLECYSNSLKPILVNHAKNPMSNALSDKILYQFLYQDTNIELIPLKESISHLGFKVNNRQFIKIKKRKIRYLCEDLANKKQYLISGNTLVEEL